MVRSTARRRGASATAGSSGPQPSGDNSDTGEAGGSSNGSEDTGDGPKLDVAGPATTGGEQDFCNFVDLLFVIDNSLSMDEYQIALAGAWPSFVDAMWENLPQGTDLHVGMTVTDFYSGDSCFQTNFNCVASESDSTIATYYETPDGGSTGVNGEQGRLFEWDGRSYYEATVGEDNGDLKTWFSGAAVAAGETGCSFEMISAAAGYALHPANEAANAGFLRDEGAVLVVIILTDEPDKSPEGADAYHQMIVDAKSGCGGDDCVIVAGIVNECIMSANEGLWQFFNSFPRFNGVGSIDDPAAYASVVGDALAQVIGDTCNEIPPAG